MMCSAQIAKMGSTTTLVGPNTVLYLRSKFFAFLANISRIAEPGCYYNRPGELSVHQLHRFPKF